MLIDTHCHLDAAEFNCRQTQLLLTAKTAGVARIVVPSVAVDNFAAIKNLCEQHSACYPAYGIHPLYTANSGTEDLVVLRDYLAMPRTVAAGEIGLDFFIKGYDQARQEYYFIEQLKLAREFDLPVLLHSRRAIDTVLKYLRKIRVRGGIAHAFSGSRQQADEFIKLGFKLGFGGAVTYLRATRLRGLAASLPLCDIVLETDAPDMPPEFVVHGEVNKPEYLLLIAQTIAQLRGIPLEDLALATTGNAQCVFNFTGMKAVKS
jgi:TatD DNase family protein